MPPKKVKSNLKNNTEDINIYNKEFENLREKYSEKCELIILNQNEYDKLDKERDKILLEIRNIQSKYSHLINNDINYDSSSSKDNNIKDNKNKIKNNSDDSDSSESDESKSTDDNNLQSTNTKINKLKLDKKNLLTKQNTLKTSKVNQKTISNVKSSEKKTITRAIVKKPKGSVKPETDESDNENKSDNSENDSDIEHES